jgi:hypothetical protein
MGAMHALSLGRERLAAVEALQDAVEDFARRYEGLPPQDLTGGDWGPREVLCHLVYWHETYLEIVRALNHHDPPAIKEGVFREFNQLAVEELGTVPPYVLLARLDVAQRRLAVELLRLSPAARIRIKTGSMARGPVEFTRRIEGHFRGHLADLRRRDKTSAR